MPPNSGSRMAARSGLSRSHAGRGRAEPVAPEQYWPISSLPHDMLDDLDDDDCQADQAGDAPARNWPSLSWRSAGLGLVEWCPDSRRSLRESTAGDGA